MRRAAANGSLWIACLLTGLIALGCSSGLRPPLLLLISVDTLRADHLGAYGSSAGLTPRIDALMEQSLVFRSAYAPCSYTLPSVSGLMTGRYPEEIGMLGNVSLLRGGAATLASVLQLHGWRTGAVVSNFVLRRSSGIDEGFEFFDDRFPQTEAGREMPERIATATTDAALAMLDRLSSAAGDFRSGTFLWVHYQDPHGPYLPPGDRRQRYLAAARRTERGARSLMPANRLGIGSIPLYQYVEGQREAAFYLAGYAGEVAYLDDQVGRLLANLEDLGWLDQATIVFTADHGEALGEGDYWFSHGEFLTEALVRVPLSIRLPKREGGVRRDPVSLVDVYPTLLALSHIPEPEGYPGRNLLAPGAASVEVPIYLASLAGSSVPRYAVVQGAYKLMVTLRGGAAHEEIFAVEDESRDLSSQRPELLNLMRERMNSVRGRLRRPPSTERQRIDAADRDLLRKLGYVLD